MLGGLRGFKGTPYEGGLRVPLLVSWPSGGVPQGARRSQVISQVDLVRTLVTLAGGTVLKGQAMDSLDFSSVLSWSPGDRGTGRQAARRSGEHHPMRASTSTTAFAAAALATSASTSTGQRTVSWHHSTIEGDNRVVYILRVGSWKAVLSMGRACSVAGDQVSGGAAKWTVDGCFDLGQFRPHVELYQLDSDPQEKQDLWHQTTTTNTTTAGGQQSEDDTLGHYRQRGDYVPQQPRGMRSDLRALVSGFLTRNAAGLSTNDLAQGDSPAARRLLACTELPCTELYQGLDAAGGVQVGSRLETTLAGIA